MKFAFFNASVSIKVNQRLVSEGEIKPNNQEDINSYMNWLEAQIKYIKENHLKTKMLFIHIPKIKEIDNLDLLASIFNEGT